MADVFVSHAEEDAEVALEVARGLRAAGYSTWTYEENSEPGTSYLLNVEDEIERCRAVVLVISPDSLSSDQVTKEVVRAHEGAKPFVPLRRGISHVEFQQRRKEWRLALGAAVSIDVPPEGAAALAPRIARGLRSSASRPDRPKIPRCIRSLGPPRPRADIRRRDHSSSRSSSEPSASSPAFSISSGISLLPPPPRKRSWPRRSRACVGPTSSRTWPEWS